MALWGLERAEGSLDALARSIALDPTTPRSHQFRTWLLYSLGRYEESAASAQEAIDAKTGLEVKMHLKRGLAFLMLKRPEDASAAFERAFELSEREAWALNWAAYTLLFCQAPEMRDPGRAEALAKEAVEKAPEKGICRKVHGIALLRLRRWSDAVEPLRKAIALEPNGDSQTAFALAVALGRLDRADEARTLYRKGVAWLMDVGEKDPDTLRLREEAKRLLGIDDDG